MQIAYLNLKDSLTFKVGGLKVMKENEIEWVKLICKQLQDELDTKVPNKYIVKTGVKMLRRISLNNFMALNSEELCFTDVDLKATDLDKKGMYFEVDLFIGEKTKNDHIIPRIVIEAKYKDINTHDPITYSYKAELHKNIYPGLRYGLMIGNYKANRKEENCYIPIKCVEFGDGFDFIFLFKGNEQDTKLDKNELKVFSKVIRENLEVSEKLESFLNKEKKCWYITKNINFGDENTTNDEDE